MNTNGTDRSSTFVETLAGIGAGAKDLAAAHVEQFRAEITAEGSQARTAVAKIAGGGAAIAVGLVFAAFAAVHVLVEHLGWYTWASYLTVAGLALAIGLPIWYAGHRRLGQVNVIPEASIKSLRESLSWIANKR